MRPRGERKRPRHPTDGNYPARGLALRGRAQRAHKGAGKRCRASEASPPREGKRRQEGSPRRWERWHKRRALAHTANRRAAGAREQGKRLRPRSNAAARKERAPQRLGRYKLKRAADAGGSMPPGGRTHGEAHKRTNRERRSVAHYVRVGRGVSFGKGAREGAS
jgi:hypothetical protein